MRLTETQLAAIEKTPGGTKRKFRLSAVTRPEADIVAEVMGSLWRHPNCAWVCRFNSGAFTREDPQTGRKDFYRFCTCRSSLAIEFLQPYFPQFAALRKATLKVPDILGMTRAGRLFALECKRGGKRPDGGQQAFLDLVAQWGGVSGVVRSGSEAVRLIES